MNFYPELPNWSVSIPQRHIYINNVYRAKLIASRTAKHCRAPTYRRDKPATIHSLALPNQLHKTTDRVEHTSHHNTQYVHGERRAFRFYVSTNNLFRIPQMQVAVFTIVNMWVGINRTFCSNTCLIFCQHLIFLLLWKESFAVVSGKFVTSFTRIGVLKKFFLLIYEGLLV